MMDSEYYSTIVHLLFTYHLNDKQKIEAAQSHAIVALQHCSAPLLAGIADENDSHRADLKATVSRP